MADMLLKFFNSLRLTLFLIVATALLSAVGTFIPQGEDNYPRLVESYGQAGFERMHALGLSDVYHSWWFLAVLWIFALNLIACTIVRLPKVWRMHQDAEEGGAAELNIPQATYIREISSSLPPAEALDKGRALLAREFGAVREGNSRGHRALTAEKNQISLWGAYIVHLGLLLLLLAGSLRIIFGFSKYMVIGEGEKAFIPSEELRLGLWMEPLPRFFTRVPSHRGTEVALDRFTVEYYGNTSMPSLFRSDVKLIENGKVVKAASIQVNQPLAVDGVMLYQASYGYDGLYSAQLDIRLPGEKDTFQVDTAPYKKKFKLLDSGWEAEITEFFPDADMAKPGELVQTSASLNNPAIRLKFYKNGVQKAHFWHVLAVPDIQMSKIPGLIVRCKTVDPIPFSVLQAAHDPGVPFALAGALTVLLGVFSSFYLFYRKMWIVVEAREGGGSHLRMLGQCKRNKLSFKRVFEKLGDLLEKEIKP